MIVCGIDPGKRTGVIIRDGDELLDRAVILREEGETTEDYSAWTAQMIAAMLRNVTDPVVVLEAVNPPTGGMGYIDPAPLLRTAQVLGYLHGRLSMNWKCMVAPPGHYGVGPLNAYPDQLVGPRETTGTGKSKFQHLRAAWDLSYAAPVLAKQKAKT